MSNDFIILIFFYFFSAISTLGYGFFIKKILVPKNISLDYGTTGLVGFFGLTLYSYLSHFLLAHNLIHNTIIFLIGVIFFFIFLNM